MKIGIVATHAHALPSKAHTGDSQVILDLARSLVGLDHDMTLFAPEGTVAPRGVALSEHRAGECYEESVAYSAHHSGIDVLHDFTIGKAPSRAFATVKRPYVSTLLGGTGYKPMPNTVVWSNSMRGRVLRGATDFEGTETPECGGPSCEPFKDVRVVYGGVDTDFYCQAADGEKGSHFLWLGRWHPARGYRMAIEVARLCPEFEFVFAGEDPERDHPYQAGCAREAVDLARGLNNVQFVWLEPDPAHHEHKRNLYQGAYAYLFTPQFQEPFGLSQVEALACGTPVLASRIGSTPEIATWTVENNAEAFARSLKDLCDDERLIAPALDRERALKFDRFVMARNYVKLYQEVLEGGGWG